MGIIYFRKSGSIGIDVKIKGKNVQFYTPLWLMQDVIKGKAKFGHFNSPEDYEKKFGKKKVVESDEGS